ncbi:MAG: Hsp70 family protein [Micromonosporaceae bacterium]
MAASAYFATVLGHRLVPGQTVVVYDLGAGTFDVSVVRRTPDGHEVVAVDGMPDFGGLDLDAIVVQRAGAVIAPHAPQIWRHLSAPSDTTSWRAFRTLWDDARGAKETLSREASAGMHVLLADRDVRVTREEFEAAATPRLQHTATLTARVMEQAKVGNDALAGLFLVGGSSRVPTVATILHRTIGVAPTVLEQPELVVAEGALHATRPATIGAPAPDGPRPVTSYLPPTSPAPLAQPPVAAPAPPPPPLPGKPPRYGSVALAFLGATFPALIALILLFTPGDIETILFAVLPLDENPSLALLEILLVIAACAGGASAIPSLLRWRPQDHVTVFQTSRTWLGMIAALCLAFGSLVATVGLAVMRAAADDPPDPLDMGENVYSVSKIFDNGVGVGIAFVGLMLMGSGLLGLWGYRTWRYPRLVLDAAGVHHDPSSQRRFSLPWDQVQHVDVRQPPIGHPEALTVWPRLGSALLRDPHVAPMWAPDVGAFTIDNVRSLGARPDALTQAIAKRFAPTTS